MSAFLLLKQRERDSHSPLSRASRVLGRYGSHRSYAVDLCPSRGMVRRLRLREPELKGHYGCVNRLAWSDEGNFLASTSDDQRVLIWATHSQRLVHEFETEHAANVFGVRFVPGTNNQRIATGAMDDTVRLHSIDALPSRDHMSTRARQQRRNADGNSSSSSIASASASSPSSSSPPSSSAAPPPASPPASSSPLSEAAAARMYMRYRRHGMRASTAISPSAKLTVDFNCHTDRIKDVQTSRHDAMMFWSVSEDGTCRQFDTRERHQCAEDGKCHNVLADLRGTSSSSRTVELKALAFNPVHPMYVAFACGDQYVRVFDRRYLRTNRSGSALPVAKHTPTHMKDGDDADAAATHATYVQYSPDGSQILATYHGEHVYLFDHHSSFNDEDAGADTDTDTDSDMKGEYDEDVVEPEDTASDKTDVETDVAVTRHGEVRKNGKLSRVAAGLKDAGNAAFQRNHFSLALVKYTEAILDSPRSAVLYSNRAMAYMRRNYFGDNKMALQDCDTAIRYDRLVHKAHYHRAKALVSMKRFEEAIVGMKRAMNLFSDIPGFKPLLEEAEARLKEENERKAQEAANDSDPTAAYSSSRGFLQSIFLRNMTGGSRRGGVPPRSGGGDTSDGEDENASSDDEEELTRADFLLSPRESAARSSNVESSASSGAGADDEDDNVRTPPSGVAIHAEVSARLSEQLAGGDGHSPRRPQKDGAPCPKRPPGSPRSDPSPRSHGRSDPSPRISRNAAAGRGGIDERGDQEPRAADQGDASGAAALMALDDAADQGDASGAAVLMTLDDTSRRRGNSMTDDDAVASGMQEANPLASDLSNPPLPSTPPSSTSNLPSHTSAFTLSSSSSPANQDEHGACSLSLSSSPAAAASSPSPSLSSSPVAAASSPSPSSVAAASSPSSSMTSSSATQSRLTPAATPSSNSSSRSLLSSPRRSRTSLGNQHSPQKRLRDESTQVSSLAQKKPRCPHTVLGHSTKGSHRRRRRRPRVRNRFGHVQRYVGHCNMQTDIKEATFFGGYIVSGSDDGRVYIWDKRTAELVNVLQASDGNVINCCQPHPHMPILATSGIENVVQIWHPDAASPSALSHDVFHGIVANQRAMLNRPARFDSLMAYLMSRSLSPSDLQSVGASNTAGGGMDTGSESGG